MKYTKKQLVKAFRLWTEDVVNNPKSYEGKSDKVGKANAKLQVEHMLSFIV